MSLVRPQDRQKVIGLIAGIVVVGALGTWRVLSALNPSGAPQTPETPAAPIASTSALPPGTAVADNSSADDAEIDVPTLFASSSADPFRTVVVVKPPVLVPKVRRWRPRLRPVDTGFTVADSHPLPMAGKPLDPTPVLAKEDSIKLNGVMPGKEAVAVITVGSETYVVKAGSTFGAGLRLKSVTGNGAEVQRGTENVSFSMGD